MMSSDSPLPLTRSDQSWTEQVENDYKKGNNLLSNLYTINRLQDNYGSRETANISRASSGFNGRSPHIIVSSDSSSPSARECAILRRDAAITTRQYLFLRDWIEQQKQVWNKK